MEEERLIMLKPELQTGQITNAMALFPAHSFLQRDLALLRTEICDIMESGGGQSSSGVHNGRVAGTT